MHDTNLWIDLTARPVRVLAAGELDLDSGDRLEAAVRRLLDRGIAEVAIDLAGVTFIDSSGVGALVALAQGEGHVTLEDASPAVLRILEMTGTRDVVDLGMAAIVRGRLAHVWYDPAA